MTRDRAPMGVPRALPRESADARDRLCDELIAAGGRTEGVRVAGRFVSKVHLEAELDRRGYVLEHIADGTWCACPKAST